MANEFSFATQFSELVDEAYAANLATADMSAENERVRYLGGNAVSFPTVRTGGYAAHKRGGGWNRRDVKQEWETHLLTHDRDVEFLVDVMDVDETSQAVCAANVTAAFLKEHAIKEMDCFRFQKLYKAYTALGETVKTEALTAANILTVFDEMMAQMTENQVPKEGRVLYVTPKVMTLLKNAGGVVRHVSAQAQSGIIDRTVTMLDDVKLVEGPAARMLSDYDFTDGCEPESGAVQMNMVLLHPEAVVAPVKHSAINLFAPGEHTQGDGYLYQNRMYTDLFLFKNKRKGVSIHAV
jgi:hypothetical protein